MRRIALVLAIAFTLGCLALAAVAEEFDHAAPEGERTPYECLPAVDADALHAARGDRLILARRMSNTRAAMWFETTDGRFLLVEFHSGTLKVCARQWTDDPRPARGLPGPEQGA